MTSTWNMRKLVIDISVNLRRNHLSSVNNLASGGNGQCFWASDVASRYLEKGYPDNRYPGQDLLCGLISKLRHILANRYLYMNADTLKKKAKPSSGNSQWVSKIPLRYHLKKI